MLALSSRAQYLNEQIIGGVFGFQDITQRTRDEQTESVMPASTAQEIRKIRKEVGIDFMREDLTALLAESQDGLKRVTRIVQDLKDFSHVDESDRQGSDLQAGLDSTLPKVAPPSGNSAPD